jgi:hypothetical protein
VGQDEDPLPLVRRADFCRREQARRRRVAHAPKLSQDGFEAEADVPSDVFEEYPFRAAFGDSTSDLGPEVPGVVGTLTFASSTEGLAGISGEDDIESTAKGSGIEAAQIVPDWGRGKIPCALGGDECSSGPILPLDKGAGVISGLRQHEAQIQASAACAEGQSVKGT